MLYLTRETISNPIISTVKYIIMNSGKSESKWSENVSYSAR